MQSACCSRTLHRRILGGLLHLTPQRTAFTMRYKPKGGKPPNFPPAKTKRYEVVTEAWMEPEDVKELLWRRQAYNTAMNSIRAMFKQELAESGGRLGIDEDIQELREADEKEFAALLIQNEKENQRLAEIRQTREAEEDARLEEEVALEVDAYFKAEEEFLKKRKTQLLQAQEDAGKAVTPETLHERILEALESPVDYNVPIDRYGVEYTSAVKASKYLDAPLPEDAKNLYQDTPLPLIPKDEDQRREKRREAGITDAPEPAKLNVAQFLD